MPQENNRQSKTQPDSQILSQTSGKDKGLSTIEELRMQLEAERQRAERESQRAEKAEVEKQKLLSEKTYLQKRLKKIFKRDLRIEDLGLKGIFLSFLKVFKTRIQQLISINFSHFPSWLWFGLKKGRILAYLTTFLLILAIFFPSVFLIGQLSKLITQQQSSSSKQTQQHFSTGTLNLADTSINLSASAAPLTFTHTNTADTKADFEGSGVNVHKGFGYLSHHDKVDNSKVDNGFEISSAEQYLVGLWHMNNNWQDAKGTNHGTGHGGVGFTTASRLGSHAGSFDGAGDYVVVSNSPILNPGNQFTIEMWFKANTLAPVWQFIAGKSSYWSTNDAGLHLRSSEIEFYVDTCRDSDYYTISTGRWYHVVGTYNGSQRRLYIDGNLVKESSCLDKTLNNNWNFTIGADNEGQYNFNGLVDELAFYNQPLSLETIKQHYDQAGSFKKTTLYRSPRFDLGVKTKPTEMIVSRTSPSGTDLKVYTRSGNSLALDTDNIDENILRDTTKAEFEAGLTKTDIEITDLGQMRASSSGLGSGADWTQATAAADWSGRFRHTSIVYDNKMWVIGGHDGVALKNDVWYSTDGITWTQATANAAWSPRYWHTSLVYDNKIWVIGGYNSDYKNDVWYSTDGITWTQATAAAAWSARYLHASVVYDNKMWVIGGRDGGASYRNDAWYSTDGITWTQATANAAWLGRDEHASVVYDNKIWVIGGHSPDYKNDVWYSTDGITWTQATANATWSARSLHTSVVYDNKMWVMGGRDVGGRKNDVWYSTDGITWTQATAAAAWSARHFHTSIVYDNKMWVIGGHDGVAFKNDVWYSTPGYALSSTYESSIIDLNSTFSIDLLVIQADLPITETQISIAARAGSPATSTCIDSVNWQTDWDSSPVFNLNSAPSGSNPKVLVHQIGINQPYRCWQYRIIGKTDNDATWVVRDVFLVPQSEGYGKSKLVADKANTYPTNIQEAGDNRYFQYLVFGASNGSAVWELDKIDLISRFSAFDLGKRYQIAKVSLTDSDNLFYRIHYSLGNTPNYLSITAWQDVGDKTAANTLSHAFPASGQALRWVRFNRIAHTGSPPISPVAIAFLAKEAGVYTLKKKINGTFEDLPRKEPGTTRAYYELTLPDAQIGKTSETQTYQICAGNVGDLRNLTLKALLHPEGTDGYKCASLSWTGSLTDEDQWIDASEGPGERATITPLTLGYGDSSLILPKNTGCKNFYLRTKVPLTDVAEGGPKKIRFYFEGEVL